MVIEVFFYALLTAIATGVGALPFFFVGRLSGRWIAASNALAGALMIGASIGLIQEGTRYSIPRTALGAVLGLLFIIATRRMLRDRDVQWGELRGADALKVLMIVGVMTLHSFTEGVGVGVSFGGGEALGLYITIAIAIHNIPEGLAISLVMVPRGTPPWKAGLWSIFSSLPQPLMAVPAFLFVETFRQALPAGLGFAAGAMLWMVAVELAPDVWRFARPQENRVT
jgi:zinc transporter ZupT